MADTDPDGTADPTTGTRATERSFEAVCWDIGGVLLDLSVVPETQRRFAGWLHDRYDLNEPVDDVVATWRTAVGGFFSRREGTEYVPAREAYARGVAAVLDDSPPTDEWLPAFREFQRETMQPTDGAIEVLETVGDHDVHQGIISDIDTAEAELLLEAFGIGDHFDAVTTSEAVGVTKPDPAMFQTAIEAGDVDPQRTLYVGDRYEHDMVGGSDAGFVTVAYGVGKDGPAIDHRIDDLREVLTLLSVSTGGSDRTS